MDLSTNSSEVDSSVLRDHILTAMNVSVVKCSDGYGAVACSKCSSGHYRLQDVCVVCPGIPYGYLLMTALGYGEKPPRFSSPAVPVV